MDAYATPVQDRAPIGGRDKSPAPACCCDNCPFDNPTDDQAERVRRAPVVHHAAPNGSRVIVGEEAKVRGADCALTDTEQGASEEKLHEGASRRREEPDDPPDHRSSREDPDPIRMVGKIS